MEIKSIKRDYLDYILTDILPVEISELFTYRYFYEYLHKNHKSLKKNHKLIIQHKNNVNVSKKLFEDKKTWASMPLKYCIMKGESSTRELNILQPLAALQIYYFIMAYQDEILFALEANSVYSIRYHKKASQLFYKVRRKSVTQYFSDTSSDLLKQVLEQSGRYFELAPYKSLVGFTNSDEWYDLNLKYKYFARIDYKSCFDSIYSHTYKWLISRDVNDSKDFKNTNLFTTIDRILQNINALSSNGLVVGPEFSRMIAELLLQRIDTNVYSILLNEKNILGTNYSVKRYVDDIFIFSETEEIRERIIELYDLTSKKFLQQINERKIMKEKLPFILTSWLSEANAYSTSISNSLFYSIDEISEKDNEESHLFKSQTFWNMKTILKRNFNDLVSKNPAEKSKLVSYALATILNKISSIKAAGKILIFRGSVSDRTLYELLDYVFYIYTYSATFDNTQKIISIISYINDEVDLQKQHHTVLQKIVDKYSFIFKDSNINDSINLILLCIEVKLQIPYNIEEYLRAQILKSDNPINVATFLLYAQYNQSFFTDVKDDVNSLIKSKINSIRKKTNALTYKEFWWLLVFNKSPYIDVAVQTLFNSIINHVEQSVVATSPNYENMKLFVDFLKNEPLQFFSWNHTGRSMMRQITYRTHERTIFKNNKYAQTSYSSIE